MTTAEKAQALAADLRYVLRKHKAQIVWKEELDGRVTVTAVIEGVTEGRSLVRGLRAKFSWEIFIMSAATTVMAYLITYRILSKL